MTMAAMLGSRSPLPIFGEADEMRSVNRILAAYIIAPIPQTEEFLLVHLLSG